MALCVAVCCSIVACVRRVALCAVCSSVLQCVVLRRDMDALALQSRAATNMSPGVVAGAHETLFAVNSLCEYILTDGICECTSHDGMLVHAAAPAAAAAATATVATGAAATAAAAGKLDLQCAAVCCSVLQCVTVCCSVLLYVQRVAACTGVQAFSVESVAACTGFCGESPFINISLG